jgi:hypothetical protein
MLGKQTKIWHAWLETWLRVSSVDEKQVQLSTKSICVGRGYEVARTRVVPFLSGSQKKNCGLCLCRCKAERCLRIASAAAGDCAFLDLRCLGLTFIAGSASSCTPDDGAKAFTAISGRNELSMLSIAGARCLEEQPSKS